MLMLMCFSVGTWAADYELVYTLDGSVTTGGNSNYAQDGGGLTQDGIDWSVIGNTTINPWRIGGKNLTNEDRLAYSKTAISDNVAKIEIEHGNINLTANSMKVEVASDADFGTILETFSSTTVEANKTVTYLRPSGQDWSNAYYRITYNVTAGSSNTYIQLKSVKFYKEKAATTEPSISIEQNGSAVTAVDFGEVASYTETENEGYVVCQSVDIKASNLNGDVYLEVENSGGNYFSIYDPRYTVSSWDKFTIKPTAGAIDTTIVLKAATWMSASTQTGKLKVSSKASTADFTALNIDLSVTVFDPAEGDYDISLNNTFFGLSATGANPDEQTGSYKGITVVAGCESTASSKTYYDAAHVRFYGGSYLKICAPYGFVVDTIIFTAGGTWNGGISADAGDYDADKKEWTGSASCVTFSFTAQDRISKATVSIIKAPEVGLPTISGQTPFYPSTTVTMSIETEGADIIYTMDGEDPLGGDNTYTQPIVLTETKTVKARGFKGVKLGDVVTKVFTKATPISVADAIELIPDAGNTKNDQFVVGYVCTASESEPSNGQMTYYISDNGSTVDEGTATTDRIQIYKGKGLNNADFTAASDLAVGDKVVVYGQLKNYNGTYEFNSGNYIVERVAKGDVASVAISGTATHGAYEGGDAFDPAGLTVTATYASGFQEDVTASATWSPATITTQSGNTDVTASFGGKTSAAKTVNISLNKYTVTFNTSVYGGTWGIQKAGEPISSGNHFPKGTVLTVVTEAVAGYKLGGITVNDQPLEGNEITIGTENITVVVEFAMVQEGVLVLSAKSLDWGTITAGTSPSSVPSKTFTLTGSNLTEGRTVTLTTPDWCHLTQTTANPTAGGNIATTSFYVYVNDATLETAGEYSGNIVISSDDLTADSLIAVSLKVVEATPSISVKDVYAQDITSIDFGNVDKGASVNQFSISMIGHHLTGDVKVTVANATSTNVFVTNGFRPSNTYSPEGGEIDAAVYVIPFTSTGGEFNGTITFHSESGDFDDIVIPLHINIKPDAGLAWTAATATAYTKAKPYELPTLTNPHDVTVAYSGNNDEVATVDAATGEVTLVAAGEVTITASFAGNGDYVAQEVEYTLTVKAPTGLRLSGEMITKEYEEGDHVSVDGYTVEAVFGSPFDYYDVTSEATWKLDGVDIATKTVTSTSEYTIEATWEGFTAWEYVNLVRKTHAVNFNDPEHGTLTVTVFGGTFISGAKFKKGTEVIISINPAVGYEGAVTVNGEPLVGNSYTIGTEDITIVATFNKVTIPKHKVTFTDGINGTFQVKKDGEAISSGNQYAEGTEFTIWTNPAKDYKVGAITINGEPIEGTSFVMGSEDIEVGVSFVLKPEPNLGWSSTSDVYAYTDNGKSYTMPTLVNPDNLDITFTTTSTVATVNADGTINLIGSGFTLVQINFEGNETYRAAHPNFRLWVCAPNSMYISEVSTHKSSYNYGEAFDYTGLKATLVYDNNGGDRDATSDAVWSSDPATVTMDGYYTITAAYGDIQATKSLYASVKAYPSIAANKTSIDFGQVNKDSSWPSQMLTITGANLTASVDATALTTGGGSVFYIEDKSYVRLTPEEGAINATVTISANPNLPVGEYYGSVKIESIAATADFQPISVDLHITIAEKGTGIDQVELEQQIRKEFRDGKLFIIRGEKTYDAAGRLVK